MKNIILIGMPGSGKSTVGKRLALKLGMRFVDTDDIITQNEGSALCDILAQRGVDYFMRLEDKTVCDFSCENCVVATGGSVVLYPAAMRHLSALGTVVYLEADFDEIQKRIKNLKTRGIVFKDGQTLADIYEERVPLYEKYADLTLHESSQSIHEAVPQLLDILKNHILTSPDKSVQL